MKKVLLSFFYFVTLYSMPCQAQQLHAKELVRMFEGGKDTVEHLLQAKGWVFQRKTHFTDSVEHCSGAYFLWMYPADPANPTDSTKTLAHLSLDMAGTCRSTISYLTSTPWSARQLQNEMKNEFQMAFDHTEVRKGTNKAAFVTFYKSPDYILSVFKEVYSSNGRKGSTYHMYLARPKTKQ